MGLKIIGALGNTAYKNIDVKYQKQSIVSYTNKDNKKIVGSPYSLITILHYLAKHHNHLVKDGVEFVVFNTEQSKEMHCNNGKCARFNITESNKSKKYEDFNKNGEHWESDYLNFRAEIDYYQQNNHFPFSINYDKNKILVKHNYNDSDKWEFFKRLYEELAKNNDKVIIDLTNGNRTLPTMIMLTANLFESINSFDLVKGVYYINSESKELVSLSDMYLITKWSSAINTLLNSGSYNNYRSLVEALVSSYDKENDSDKKSISEGINKVSKCLEDVVDALKLMRIGFYMKFKTGKKQPKYYNHLLTFKIFQLLKNIYLFKNKLSEKTSNDEVLIILKTIDGIEQQFHWFNIKDIINYNDKELRGYLNENFYLHVYEILQYYKNHEMYQQAITLIKEVLFTSTKKVYDVIDKSRKKDEINSHKIVSYYKKLYDKISSYLEANQENKEFRAFNNKLNNYHDLRNKINHAFQIPLKIKYYDESNRDLREYEFVFDTFKQTTDSIKNKAKFNNNEIESFINDNDHLIKEFAQELNKYHKEIITELEL